MLFFFSLDYTGANISRFFGERWGRMIVSTWPECLVLFPPSFHPQRLNKGTNVHPFLTIKGEDDSKKNET